ncbi:MAG: hypothetical protein HY812_19820 [Planctomycetes bacterium]|nr:hypothetical protein [Planctomycetota bacterium]
MPVLENICIADISGQKRLDVRLNGEITLKHTVGQVVDHFLDAKRIPRNELRWSAFSRGVMLDHKQELGDLHQTDDQWRVIPEVSAG